MGFINVSHTARVVLHGVRKGPGSRRHSSHETKPRCPESSVKVGPRHRCKPRAPTTKGSAKHVPTYDTSLFRSFYKKRRKKTEQKTPDTKKTTEKLPV